MVSKSGWYELDPVGALQQGDLLFDVDLARPDWTVAERPLQDDLPLVVETADVLLLTQSCDLENRTVDSVVVCVHHELAEVPEFRGLGVRKELRKGRRTRYRLLEGCPEANVGVRVVDLGNVHTLPVDYLTGLAADGARRLRLRPPYREYVSQAFATLFMRVALPHPVQL